MTTGEFTLDLENLRDHTEKFKRVNAHVYELLAEEDPDAVIVLFHGLAICASEREHAFWSTWRKRNSYDCWPITLLPKYLEPCRIRVLAMFYESGAEVPSDVGSMDRDRYLLAENFVTSLITSGLCRHKHPDMNVPIILIGHDLGGILVKNFIMYVEDRCSNDEEGERKEKMLNFLANLKLVIFYATPHHGSLVFEDLAKRIPEETENQLLKLTRVLDKELDRINLEFTKYRWGLAEGLKKSRFNTFALVPTQRTNQKGFTNVMVVEEASARYDVDDSFSVEADHFEVCQPQDLPNKSLHIVVEKFDEEISKYRDTKLEKRFTNVMVAGGSSARYAVNDSFPVLLSGSPHDFSELSPHDFFEMLYLSKGLFWGYQDIPIPFWQVKTELEKSRKSLLGVALLLSKAKSHLGRNAFLGLVGRGGVGKTALARHVFETLCENSTFEYTCFVENLRQGHTKEIRLQAGKNMRHHGKLISTSDKAYSDLWSELTGKKLLLVFDDISQLQQAEVLQEIADDNAMIDSLFIATGRDEQLLRTLRRRFQTEKESGTWLPEEKEIHILRVDPLAFEDARKLFTVHAFPERQEPPDHLRVYVDNVVYECGGLPLTLKIMGGYLREFNDEDKWMVILESLQEANASFFSEERQWAMLRLSFDGLRWEEKEMFLDVACFLLHEHCPFSFEEVRSAWSSMYIRAAERWQTLLDRSLVAEQETRSVVYNQESTQRLADAAGGSTTLTDNAAEVKITEVHMQKDLRTFGERVAEEMGRYYLLHSVPPGRAFTVDTGRLEGTVALTVNIGDLGFLETPGKDEGDLHRYSRCREVQENFEHLKAIRYLELRVPWHVPCMFCESMGGIHLRSGLRILHWSGYNINIHFSFEAVGSLTVLKLDRKDECFRDILSPKVCRYLTHLERLELASNDCRLPDEFGKLRRLQHLEIHCENLSMLPEGFSCLTSLKCLRLHHCKQLRTLPESFGKLSSLEILRLDSCIQFESFSKSFVDLSALVDLSLNECMNLQYLPEDFGNLYHLRRLSLDHCGSLETLPESFGNLTLLESLSLDYCWELKCLPESLGNLLRLHTLSLGYCLELEELPESLGNLSALELLNLDHCTGLQLLPSNFGNLSSLRRLNLEFCPKLLSLPETFWDLSRLERLSVRCSPQLEPFLEKSGVYPFWKNSD